MAMRMMNSEYCGSDMFTSLTHKAQALYIQLMLVADDDGFIGNPKKIAIANGCKERELNELANDKHKFIYRFESGCVVIKHWWCHNKIRPDRKKETQWQDELKLLTKKSNGAYTLADNMPQSDGQNADNMPHKLSKVKLSKVNIVKEQEEKEISADNFTQENTETVTEEERIEMTKILNKISYGE